MKRIVAALGLTIASTSVGAAADLPERIYTKTPAAQVYNWTGFYIGANAGVGLSRDPASVVIASTPAGGSSSVVGAVGAFGGGQIGYNWQTGNILFGVETDFQGAALQDDRTCTLTCMDFEANRYDQHLDWFGTARGRIGLTTGSVLGYVTGGLAYGGVTTANLVSVGASTTPFYWHQTRTGWTVGSGIEAALPGNWTGKVEYLYLDLGSDRGILPLAGTGGVTSSIDYRQHIVRVGVNYRFGRQQSGASEPPANWRGLYAGGNLGTLVGLNPSSSELSIFGLIASSDKYNLSPRGLIGGGQLGYNWQAGSVVVGLETDFQGASAKGGGACVLLCEPGVAAINADQRLNWLGTTRGRVGLATGSALFYLTGGLAYGDVTTRVVQLFPFLPSSDNTFSHSRTGYAVGAGIETQFDPFGLFGHKWSAKTEYLYSDLGTVTDSFKVGPEAFAITNTMTTHVQEHVFRTGLNYHFSDTSF